MEFHSKILRPRPRENLRVVERDFVGDGHRVGLRDRGFLQLRDRAAGLRDLQFIRVDSAELRFGALTRQRQLERDPRVKRLAPLLHEALPFIAHPQIRNRGTLGGSLAHADPAAELPVVAVALDARLKIQSARGERWVVASQFFKGLFVTDLGPDEMLTEVVLPALPDRTGTAFVEFARRRGDYALMGVAALITLDRDGACQAARLVYLNAGDAPVIAVAAAALLAGHKFSVALSNEAANVAAEREISPMGNVHASAEYQRHLAKVLARRAIQTAFGRAEKA